VETRPYRSQRRASAAAETRRFVLEAALAAFGEHGYVKATIAGIAARADVAVNTVYASVGGKPQLLVALIEDAADSAFVGGVGLAASEPRTADEVFQRLEQVAAKLFLDHGWLLSEVYSIAGTDPAILQALQAAEARFAEVIAGAARQICALGELRPGLDAADAADVLWFYLGFRRWKALLDRGWSTDRARTWLTEQAAAAILLPAQRA